MRIVYGSLRSVRRAAALAYTSTAVGLLSGLVYTPWMIGVIGQANYAIYSLALSTVALVALDLGLTSAASRFLAVYLAKGDLPGAGRVLGVILKVFVILAAILMVSLSLIFFLSPVLFHGLSEGEIDSFRLCLAVFGFYSVVTFPLRPLDGVLLASELLVPYKALELAQRLLTVTLMAGSLLMGGDLFGLIIANIFANMVVILLRLRAVVRHTEVRPEFRVSERGAFREVFNFGVWTTIISVAQRLIINITPLILASRASVKSVAVFAIATTIEGYVFALAGALNGLFLPRVTKLVVGPKLASAELLALLIKVGRFQFMLIGTIVGGFLLLGDSFIRLWVGTEFKDSYQVTVLLLLPAILTATMDVAQTALIAAGDIRQRAIASLIVASISLPLSIVLSPKFGALGAAMGIFVGSIVGSIGYMVSAYARHLRLNVAKFFLEVHVKMGVWLCLGAIVTYGASTIHPIRSWGDFTLHGLGYMFVLSLFLGISKTGRDELLRLVGRGAA